MKKEHPITFVTIFKYAQNAEEGLTDFLPILVGLKKRVVTLFFKPFAVKLNDFCSS